MSWRYETNADVAHWIPKEESTLALCGRDVYGGPAKSSMRRCQKCKDLVELEQMG